MDDIIQKAKDTLEPVTKFVDDNQLLVCGGLCATWAISKFISNYKRNNVPLTDMTKYGDWALVTGASSGIGRAFAIELAKAGLNVVCTARSVEKLNAVVAEIKEAGGHAISIPADLSTPNGVRDLTIEIDGIGLVVNVLVANAGFGQFKHFIDCEPKMINDMINVNITSLVNLCHIYSKTMSVMGNGAIALISSVGAAVPASHFQTYDATKAFVSTFGVGLREELLPKGIDVTVMEPGRVPTEFAECAGFDEKYLKIKSPGTSTAENVAQETMKALLNSEAMCWPNRTISFMTSFLRVIQGVHGLECVARSTTKRFAKMSAESLK